MRHPSYDLTKPLNPNRALTTGVVAKLCGVAPRTVSKWIDSKQLPGYRLPLCDDRRVMPAALYNFMLTHGIPVPFVLAPPAVIAYGLEPVDVDSLGLPAQVPDAVELGVRLASEPIGLAVVGCADGYGRALGAGQAIRSRNAEARIVLVCDESTGAVTHTGEVWTACVQRPFDPAAVRSLLAGQTGGVPCRDR